MALDSKRFTGKLLFATDQSLLNDLGPRLTLKVRLLSALSTVY